MSIYIQSMCIDSMRSMTTFSDFLMEYIGYSSSDEF